METERDMSRPTPQERARSLLARNHLMTLATVDGEGRPWASPVFYSLDDDGRLYWTSDRDARHSANVRATGRVAIVVHDAADGHVDALYLDATATELNEAAEVEQGTAVMRRRDALQPARWHIADVAEVSGAGPWRIYRATPAARWVRSRSSKQGKPVVTRTPAD